MLESGDEPLKQAVGLNISLEDIENDYQNKRGALQSRLDKALSRLTTIESVLPRV